MVQEDLQPENKISMYAYIKKDWKGACKETAIQFVQKSIHTLDSVTQYKKTTDSLCLSYLDSSYKNLPFSSLFYKGRVHDGLGDSDQFLPQHSISVKQQTLNLLKDIKRIFFPCAVWDFTTRILTDFTPLINGFSNNINDPAKRGPTNRYLIQVKQIWDDQNLNTIITRVKCKEISTINYNSSSLIPITRHLSFD